MSPKQIWPDDTGTTVAKATVGTFEWFLSHAGEVVPIGKPIPPGKVAVKTEMFTWMGPYLKKCAYRKRVQDDEPKRSGDGLEEEKAHQPGMDYLLGLFETCMLDGGLIPWEMYSVAMSTVVNAKENGNFYFEDSRFDTLIDTGYAFLHALRTHAHILKVHRTWQELGSPNIYQAAAAMPLSATTQICAIGTFVLQSALVTMCFLGLNWETFKVSIDPPEVKWEAFYVSMAPVAAVVAFNIVPFVLYQLRAAEMRDDVKFWEAAREKTEGSASRILVAIWYAADELINKYMLPFLIVITFLLIACTEDMMDAVLNSVALLFISVLDDEVVAYLPVDARGNVIAMSVQYIARKHEHQARMHNCDDERLLGEEAVLPDTYQDITIGCHHGTEPVYLPKQLAELRIIGLHHEANEGGSTVPNVVIDPTMSRGNYCFSKIRYQIGDRHGKVIEWLEFTPYDSTQPSGGEPFSTGQPFNEDEYQIQELVGVLVVVNKQFYANMYSMRVLRFGTLSDVDKFFNFFWSDPFFAKPATDIQTIKKAPSSTVASNSEAELL